MSLLARLKQLEQKAASIVNKIRVVYAGVNTATAFTAEQVADKSIIYVYVEV